MSNSSDRSDPTLSVPDKVEFFLKLLETRRSVRRFSRDVPDPGLIDTIIKCASYAPSAHNSQPWRFYILSDPVKRAKLLVEMAQIFRQDLEMDGSKPDEINKCLARSRETIGKAPVLILVCIETQAKRIYNDQRRSQAEHNLLIQSAAAAVQNLLLSAHALGLAGCWFSAPIFCPEVVQTSLKIPNHHEPQGFIALGYAADSPAKPVRIELNEIRFRI